MPDATPHSASARQKGYVLLAVMLFVTLLLIAMGTAAPRIGQQIKREKEEELIHRGQEYAAAIRKFYRRNGTYPISLDQLENTNHVRYLRKRFVDPMTGRADWKLIHVGEAQLPLGPPGAANPAGQAGAPSAGTSQRTSPSGGQVQPDTRADQSSPGTSTTSDSSTQLSGATNQATAGPIIGVASRSKATSIKELNGKSHYDQWEFVYDPRFDRPGTNGIVVATPGSTSTLPTSPQEQQSPK